MGEKSVTGRFAPSLKCPWTFHPNMFRNLDVFIVSCLFS